MSDLGLRERKKRQTRQHIADTAARLFGERGYENVSVADVARAADVSEQTVYNYFPTKRDLVFDLQDVLQARLTELIGSRPKGVSPAAAVRDEALTWVQAIKDVPAEQQQGGLDYLAAISPAVRRLALEVTDQLADAVAAALIATTPGLGPQLAKLQAIALVWVFQTITDESGRRKLAGQDPLQFEDELLPLIKSIIDNLDRWFSTQDCGSQTQPRKAKRPSRSTGRSRS